MDKGFFTDWLDLIKSNDELSAIAAILPADIPEAEKTQEIQKQLLALFLRHAHTARLYHARQASDEREQEALDGIMSSVGKVLIADFALLKSHGFDYAMLISILNADSNKISEIKSNGDENLSFDELIIKYDLANGRYKAVEMALKKGRAE